jgi:hypothetical protein
MNKKPFIGLAPLLAIAAFAVMPMAAQAEPHVYKNGAIGGKGAKVRTISWGAVSLHSEKLGELECHLVSGGFLENPTGGGSATGVVQAWTPYECSDTTCSNALGTLEVVSEHLPWIVAVTEPSAGVFRLNTGKKGEKGGSGSIEIDWNCSTIAKINAFGEFAPRFLNNGLSIGAAPGQISFDVESGELEGESRGIPLIRTQKYQGFGGQELIEVKNP